MKKIITVLAVLVALLGALAVPAISLAGSKVKVYVGFGYYGHSYPPYPYGGYGYLYPYPSQYPSQYKVWVPGWEETRWSEKRGNWVTIYHPGHYERVYY